MIVLWRCDVGSGCDFLLPFEHVLWNFAGECSARTAARGFSADSMPAAKQKVASWTAGPGETVELVLLMKYDYIYTKY